MDGTAATVNYYTPRVLLNGYEALTLIRRMLRDIGLHVYEDRRLAFIEESERTAYIAVSIARQGGLTGIMPDGELFLLALFSNIGAYRFILPNFTSTIADTAERDYTYSYYFLKYMSPLSENIRFLLFYNAKYTKLSALKIVPAEYAHLIFFAARMEAYLRANNYAYTRQDIASLDPAGSGSCCGRLFIESDGRDGIVNKLRNGTFLSEIDDWSHSVPFTEDDTFKLIKMFIYIMDFKSTATVTHTINTACLAAAMGRRMHCTARETDELYTAGILHDVGKMAVASRILESPSKLSCEDMAVMRTHVEKGISMFHGVVPAEVESIAARHHEKIDGSGYPAKVSADGLSLQDRILTVADITSALTDTRSYKDSFSREKTIHIIMQMTAAGQIDPAAAGCVTGEFDSLQAEMQLLRKPLTAEFGRISEEFQAAEMTENL